MAILSLHSPVGDLTLFEEEGAIVALDWGWGADQCPNALLEQAKIRLDAYFDGAEKRFDLALSPKGTNKQKKIWRAISDIPYGRSITYGALAAKAGTIARAAGAACGANPIPILIPCHRVLAADGRLTGYSGGEGVETKNALLQLEGARRLL